MKIGQYELDILVHGHTVDEFVHEGETFIEGRNKREYIIRVRNNSSQRVLAVVSVDGLSVMDGKEARLRAGGYVIEPRNKIEIPGWRINNDEVAKFVFGSYNDSYAAKMDKPTNIGVIGCAIFEEKPKPFPVMHHFPEPMIPSWPPRRPRIRHGGLHVGGEHDLLFGSHAGQSLERGAIGASVEPESPTGVQNLGTGFGERTEHQVINVDFDAKDECAAVFQIVYDTKAGLEKRGVQVKGPIKVALNAFPAGGGGCEPPNGWRYR